ncbi:hypothetical protein ABVK25_007319 [Lepraria finkii]|uniref:non-specific serine/threonine protein kinase n=1 Tax=Lepraria finkii TaxID=1340010 RepID=A0ABR4B3G7_9LECA
MMSPCDCAPSWTWERHREGDFFCVGVRGEPLIQYRSGGYHPVHLGDTLHGGRYTIIHKLGWGRDGTNWLATDSKYSRLVAIKICRSEIRHENEEEATLLRRLMTGPAEHPGKKHVVQLLDRFEISGPNGRHLCLAMEALGPGFDLEFLSPDAAWEVARQMVEGVSYIHDMGITHGDLRRKKFWFTNTRFLHQDGDPTKPPKKPVVDDVQPVDGLGNVLPIYGSSVTARVPQYLVDYPWTISSEALTYSDNSNHTASDYQVKLIGFGNTRMIGEVQGFSKDYDFGYQAPEVLLDSQLGPSADIWSLACLIYEILIRDIPYCPCSTKDDMIHEWIGIFGNLPEEWESHCCSPRPSDLCKPGQENMRDTLKDGSLFILPGTLWFSKGDLDTLGDLLTSMTQYRPSDRPSAAEVLKHPWFQHRPSLAPVDGPSREEAEAAYALYKAEYLKKWNADESSVIWGGFLSFWLSLKPKAGAP